MKKITRISWISLLLLVSLIAAPVLAATLSSAAACPSSCSCLLPDEAKKLGSSGYCGGKQLVCGSDTLKNEKYCFEKPAVAPSLIITAKPFVTTLTKPATSPSVTTVPPVTRCPSGCTCLNALEGKTKGLATCGEATARCGNDPDGTPRFCFVLPADTTTAPQPRITAILPTVFSPTPVPTLPGTHPETPACSPGCICLLPADATAKGLSSCGGAETACSVDGSRVTGGKERFCYTLPGAKNISIIPAVMVTTPLPAAGKCPEGCSCLDEKTIRDRGHPFCGLNRTLCGYSKTSGELFCANTGAVTAGRSPGDGDLFSAIGVFFSSLFGGGSGLAAPDDTPMYADYCRMRYGLDRCGSSCVNLSTDNDNCGSCGHWCRYTTQVHEQCHDGQCIDINSDPANCGGYGNVCPDGAPCISGYCSALGCLDSDLSACNNSCTDTRSSSFHCGACGNACPEGRHCSGGTCTSCEQAGQLRCPVPGESYSRCTDILSDRDNCGRCQHACTLPEVCVNGECSECPAGTNLCRGFFGGSTGCEDLQTSRSHCGACDNACGREQTCIAGTCTCPEGSTKCGDDCVDLLTNSRHCRACGNACPPGGICVNGECTCSSDSCPAPTSCIDGVCRCPGYEAGMRYCNGHCVNTEYDDYNCGNCGFSCPSYGLRCSGGVCVR